MPEALATVRTVGFETARASALGLLLPYLSDELLPEAVSIVESFEEKFLKRRCSWLLESSLRTAEAGLRKSKEQRAGFRAFPKVLALRMGDIKKYSDTREIPAGLVSHLLGTFSAALPKSSRVMKIKKLAQLGRRLSTWSRSHPDIAYPVWVTTLHQISNYHRPVLLYIFHDLMPFPLALAGGDEEKAAVDIFRAIQVVTRWWP